MIVKKKRARCEEDSEAEEEALYYVLAAYTDHLSRSRAALAVSQNYIEAVIRAYVASRGGLKEIQVFEVPCIVFNPDSICPKTYTHEFRFTRAQLERIVFALINLGVSPVIRTRARDRCTLLTALCMLCMKFAWPTRLGSMVRMFGTSMSRMSRIIGELRRILFDMFAPALASPPPLSLCDLERFAGAVAVKSGSLNIFGFIDATVRPIPKPTYLQAAVYNGKDRVHAIKYQALVTPDGMLHQLAGPWPGSRHDMHMLHKSKLRAYVAGLPVRADGTSFVVYADQGYAQSPEVETPFFDGATNSFHEAINQAMASSRIAVEWAFGDIVLQWASLDMKRTQQLLSQRKIAQIYLVAGLLSNFMNCFHPNRGSEYFRVAPPSFEEYIVTLKARAQNL
jgi:hypothetical protein